MADDPQKRQAHTIGTSILVEPPGASAYLVAQIEIDCPVCGRHIIRFAGHHLRAIRNFLVETIDQYPEQTLREGDVHALEPLTFRGPGNDPGRS